MTQAKLIEALRECRSSLADQIEADLDFCCGKFPDGTVDESRMDELSRPSIEAERALLAKVDAALADAQPQTEREVCECLTCGRMHPKLANPPWAIEHEDACHLSRIFNRHTPLRTEQDIRINEWLKQAIRALKSLPLQPQGDGT